MKKWQKHNNVGAFTWSDFPVTCIWSVKAVHFLVIFTTVGPVFFRFFRFLAQYPENWKNNKIMIISLLAHNPQTLMWFSSYMHMVCLASSLFGDFYYCRTCFLQIFRILGSIPRKWKNDEIAIMSVLLLDPPMLIWFSCYMHMIC